MIHLHVHDGRGTRHWRRARDAEWHEEQHKRDEGGQFTSSGGSEEKSGGSEEKSKRVDFHDPKARQEWINGITDQYGLPHQELSFDPDLSADDILAHASGSGIALNPDFFGHPEKFAEHQKKWQGMTADPSPEGTLLHELGHKMYQNILPPKGLSNRASSKWAREKEAILQKYFDPEGAYPSLYAQEHSHEWAAEAFLAAHNGKTGWQSGYMTPWHTEQHEQAVKQAKALWQELYAHGDRDANGRLKAGAKPRVY